MSESQADDAPRSFLREALKRRIVSQFDAALVGGPSHAAYVERLGLPRTRVHFGYNAVDNVHFWSGADMARAASAENRERLGLPERYILASARFIAKKNLPNLVTAYASAVDHIRDAPDLVILGDGREREAIEQVMIGCGVGDRVHLPGFKGYEALPAYYGLSEGFVHVATVEQWGLVINEAMAAGVPIVASRNCGATRTVVEDGVTGLVVGSDVAAISDGLVRLFGMTAEERLAMGCAARTAIGDWGPERFGSGLRAAVDSAASAPRRGRVSFLDRSIFRRLEAKIIETVS